MLAYFFGGERPGWGGSQASMSHHSPIRVAGGADVNVVADSESSFHSVRLSCDDCAMDEPGSQRSAPRVPEDKPSMVTQGRDAPRYSNGPLPAVHGRLPANYTPDSSFGGSGNMMRGAYPAWVVKDSDWSSGLFDCCGSRDVGASCHLCALGFCLPCVLYGSNMEQLRQDEVSMGGQATGPCGAWVLLSVCPALFAIPFPLTFLIHAPTRLAIRRRYGLSATPCSDAMTTCFCPCCALIQEAKELQFQGTRQHPLQAESVTVGAVRHAPAYVEGFLAPQASNRRPVDTLAPNILAKNTMKERALIDTDGIVLSTKPDGRHDGDIGMPVGNIVVPLEKASGKREGLQETSCRPQKEEPRAEVELSPKHWREAQGSFRTSSWRDRLGSFDWREWAVNVGGIFSVKETQETGGGAREVAGVASSQPSDTAAKSHGDEGEPALRGIGSEGGGGQIGRSSTAP